ncbi:MAG: ROK family transcriptional regulator [Propionibacteriaceae bacterium]|jgi:predicted NBD/HSP70 family sugar kinase|nr:ROK family transcriptional regulator [Propionibacteriaceae bacterium]
MPVNRVPPGSQTSLREANRARILDIIKRVGAMTQVELADATGLSAATVSTIVSELVASGIVTTTQVTRSGRRASQVTLSRHLGLFAGIHFSFRELRIVLADPLGTVVGEQRMPLPADHRADTTMDRAAQLVSDMLEAIGAPQTELIGAGLGICAPYDQRADTLTVPGLLRGWDEVTIAESMSRRLGKPVVADNDANLAMLGEARFGIARDADSAVYVSISHGVGGGILHHGEILRGATGTAGEIGHIRVVENGLVCRCGNRGCLEMQVNSVLSAAVLREEIGALTLRDIVSMAMQGDLRCARLIAEAATAIGVALSALCNVVNPEVIIVGGELANAGPLLIAPLQAAVERGTLHNPLNPPVIELSLLGENAAVLGAAAYAFDSIRLPVRALEVPA